MPVDTTPTAAVLADIDAANRNDPHKETDGRPKELVYGERMSAELKNFAPDASDLLSIAARAQHLERWIIPRSDYPMDRSGYKKWRTELGMHHARRAAEIMATHGYSEADCQRVSDMLQKKKLKRDADVQTLEDVICLVFIRFYLDDFAQKHDEAKLIGIIQKTWNKMSDKGHEAALKIDLPEHLTSLIGKALAA